MDGGVSVTDDGNDFVDGDCGGISGTMTASQMTMGGLISDTVLPDDKGNSRHSWNTDYIEAKDATGVVVLTAKTDSNGKYLFNNLERGGTTIPYSSRICHYTPVM